MTPDPAILVVDCGSSSVKFALFAADCAAPRRLWSGALERLGLPGGRFSAATQDGGGLFDETLREAHALGIIEPCLIGDPGAIDSAAKDLGWKPEADWIIPAPSDPAAAAKVVVPRLASVDDAERAK